MQDLEEILEGQDLSLVWRRDGLGNFPLAAVDRIAAYRRMVSLKTGALFRLLDHLVLENRSMDNAMTLVAYVTLLVLLVYGLIGLHSSYFLPHSWYSQLPNDCKNLYSSEYARLKGSIGEDLRNCELTYYIVLGLDASDGYWVVKALTSPSPRNVRNALKVIRNDAVRAKCLAELTQSGSTITDWLELWGRKEKLDLKD
jgi:geranylgeranyldiphosphate transferase